MTVSEALTVIKRDLDQQGTTGRFSDTDLLEKFNEIYTDFCRYTQIRTKVSEVVTSALDPLFSFPSDFVNSRQFRWSYNQTLYPRNERTLDWDDDGWLYEVGTPEELIYANYNAGRLKPMSSSAGTVTIRHAYIPATLTSSDTPLIPSVWHDALIDGTEAMCFAQMREYENAVRSWKKYQEARDKAKSQSRVMQRTPDTMFSQKPVTVFNYKKWRADR